MRNILLVLTGCFFLLFSSFDAKASTIWGADISWTCNGDSSFAITLNVYTDCNSTQPASSNITLVPQICSGGSNIVLSGNFINGKDITPVCKNSCTRCSNSSCSFQYGIEQWQQIQTVHFQQNACCRYAIEWEECCRDTALTTIKAGYLGIIAIFSRCDTPCDNSPYFTNPPISIITVGKPYLFNNGVVDVNLDSRGNADSLVYSLSPALDSIGAPYTYNSPYNYKEPLDYSGAFGNPNKKWDPAHNIYNGFHLDSITGDLYFEPIRTDKSVISIVVQVWKKDALGNPYLSSVIRRDAEIVVMDSTPNHPPTLTGINGATSTDINFCENQFTCFKIDSYDQDTADSVTITWNQAIPGATFTANNKQVKHPEGTFCWEPTQARSYPYYFVVNAQDNACPVNGRTSRAFAIHVLPQPEAHYSSTSFACGTELFKASPVIRQNVPGIVSYLWQGPGSPPLYSTSDSFYFKYRLSGSFIYYLTLTGKNGCVYTYDDSAIVPKYAEVFLPGDTTVCEGTTMKISSVNKFRVGALSYKWNVNEVNLSNTTSFINYTFIQTGDTVPVVAVVTDAGTGCTNYDSMKVRVVPIRALFNVQDTNCLNTGVNFMNNSKASASCGIITNWLWAFGDGNTDTVQNPIHIYTKPGGYTAILKIMTAKGCTDSFFRQVYIDSPCTPILNAGFYTTGNDCIDSSISFLDTSTAKFSGIINKWNWAFGDGNTDSVENPTHKYTAAGNFSVRLSISTNDGFGVFATNLLKIDSCNATGIQSLSPYSGIRIYPNPATSTLNIDAGTNMLNSITVFDAVGRVIYSQTQGNFGKVFELPTTKFPSGIYFMKLGIGDGYYMTRFMKE